MRVVGGTAGGRRLHAPAGRALRPTSERVREAVFSSLESMGGLDGAAVLDLFAGTGALGIEALSRGASDAVFVDADPDALAAVRSNLEATGLTGSGHVVRSDVVKFLERQNDVFDVAFADPPYEFQAWDEVLTLLGARIAVLESDRALEPDGSWRSSRWRTTKQKRYGDTVVTVVVQRADD
jgi:16S rRNA (guanine966-N2)-methyltransferase